MDKQHLFCSYQQWHEHKPQQLKSTSSRCTLQSGHANHANKSSICQRIGSHTPTESPRPVSESTLLMCFHQPGHRTVWPGGNWSGFLLFFSWFILILFDDTKHIVVHSREKNTTAFCKESVCAFSSLWDCINTPCSHIQLKQVSYFSASRVHCVIFGDFKILSFPFQ